jgi:hypothetical protein
MLSLSYLLVLTNILSSTVTCTPFEQQKPLIADVVLKQSIPGGSTFEYCPESDPENDIFAIGFLPTYLPLSHLTSLTVLQIE